MGRYEMGNLYQDDEDKIRELLVGHKVTKVADDKLALDDGTILTVYPNIGGCSCGDGDYVLTALNGCDNIITNVSVQEEPAPKDEDGYDGGTIYSIFVFAENKALKLVEVAGDDGNGYYGTGFEISIQRPKVAAS